MTSKILEKIPTFEELLKIVKPKSIWVMLEVEPGHTFEDRLKNMLNVDKIDKVLNRIERADLLHIDVDNCLVYRRPVKKGQAETLPIYAFLDKKIKWKKIQQADLCFVFRLDWQFQIVQAKVNGVDVLLPYTILVEEPNYVWFPD